MRHAAVEFISPQALPSFSRHFQGAFLDGGYPGLKPISANLRKECILSRRDPARSAWKQEKSGPVPEGRLIRSLVPEIRPEALSDLRVQDRNPFLGTKDTVDV